MFIISVEHRPEPEVEAHTQKSQHLQGLKQEDCVLEQSEILCEPYLNKIKLN